MLERSGFLTLYISLMSIILNVVIAVFARSQMPIVKSIEEALLPALPQVSQAQDIQYSDLFINEKVNTARAEPLGQILKEHDLILDVDIFVAVGGQESTAIAKAAGLAKYLLSQGVPNQSLRIKANLQQQSPIVELRFISSVIPIGGDQHGSLW